MKKSFLVGVLVCLLFSSAEVVSAPTIRIIGAMDGNTGQFDFPKPNYDMTELNVTPKDLSGAECINIAGRWSVSESGTGTCVYAGIIDSVPLSGSGTVDILQNGCNISYVTPSFNVVRSGQITGNQINFSGAFFVPLDAGITIFQNSFTLTGTVNEEKQFTLKGTGVAAGTAYGIPFSCTENSTAEFSQNTTTVNDIECLLNWAENAYPNLFSPAGAISQFQSPYTYRYYSNTNSYVGVSSINNHVYYLGPDGVLQDVGPLSNWLPLAGCQ
ncbi:MAG: hypothetical protein PHD43_11425 [Methylococcales bacterium]|nr:hypothetical protein [Methylococcales bacterium]